MNKRALIYQTLEDSLLSKTGSEFKQIILQENLTPSVCIEFRNLINGYKTKIDLFVDILNKEFERKIEKLNATTPENEALFCQKVGRNFNNNNHETK